MTIIALVGADGAGKTTVAKAAVLGTRAQASYLYMGFNPESHRFALPTSRLALQVKKRLLARRMRENGPPEGTGEDFTDWGHVSLSDHPVVEVLRLFNRLVEAALRSLIALILVAKGRVVLTDRHFIVDDGLDRLLGRRAGTITRRGYEWLLVNLFPLPDLVIHLDAPSEVLYDRKGEGDLGWLRARQNKYRQASEAFDDFAAVDATRPLATVVQDVVALIDGFAAHDRRSR